MAAPQWKQKEKTEMWPRLKKNGICVRLSLGKLSDGNFTASLGMTIIMTFACFFFFSFFPFTLTAFQHPSANGSRASYLLLLKFSNPKISNNPMDWRVFLGFWEVGLKMAELILFTIHRKIRPYIPWGEIKVRAHHYSLWTNLSASCCVETMISNYAWRPRGNQALWVHVYHKRPFNW